MASGVSLGHCRLQMSHTDCVGGMIRQWCVRACVCVWVCVCVANVTLTRRDRSRSSEILTHMLDFKTLRRSIPNTHKIEGPFATVVGLHIIKNSQIFIGLNITKLCLFYFLNTCLGYVNASNSGLDITFHFLHDTPLLFSLFFFIPLYSP